MRQRPFGIAGVGQGVPLRVRAPHACRARPLFVSTESESGLVIMFGRIFLRKTGSHFSGKCFAAADCMGLFRDFVRAPCARGTA